MKVRNKRGLTFIEVLVTVAILATGIVFVYQAFFVSIDYINHTSYRLYANLIINNKLTELQEKFSLTGHIPLSSQGGTEVIEVNNKEVEYRYTIQYSNIGDLKNILFVNFDLSWPERGRWRMLSRGALVSKK